jgi:hypothetical protein
LNKNCPVVLSLEIIKKRKIFWEEKKILIWLFMIPIGSLWINDFKLLFRALFVVLFWIIGLEREGWKFEF